MNIYYAIISEVFEDRARVSYNGATTDFLPVLQSASDFVKHWIPLRVGERCVVISPSDANSGCVMRGMFHASHPSPSFDEDTEVKLYHDGTQIAYSSKDGNKKLFVEVKGGDIEVKCKEAKVESEKTVVKSGEIELGADGLEKMLKAESFMKYFNEHTHTGNLGAPTSTPVPPMEADVLSGIVKNS